MKKKPKGKQNWFKIQFEKHPYIYSALIGWPILIYIFGEFIDPLVRGYFEDVLAIIILSFPIIIFFLWFRKNKSKAKSFYKRKKKIFNRVYFYLGSVFSLIPIACIVGIIATGGVSNFIERVKFETISLYFSFEGGNYCQSPNYFWTGGYPTDHIKFQYKQETQFTNYYKDEFKALKNDDSFVMNHCYATRFFLREAHEGNEKAKEILVAYPPDLRIIYQFPPDSWSDEMQNYIFSSYEKNIANMDLDNPAVAYSYAVYLDKNLDHYWFDQDDFKFHIKPDALKYLKKSAEDGYFIAMHHLSSIYSSDFNFDISNCDKIIEYTNALAEEKSIWNYYQLMWGYMGRFSNYNHKSKAIYNCSNQKTNFSKAFSMLINRPTAGASEYQLKKSGEFNSSYPAIFYLNGWGDVEQDYDKAYELFSYSVDKIDSTWGIPDQVYIAYMNFKGMGVEQNQNKGKGLAIELAKKIDLIDKSQIPDLLKPANAQKLNEWKRYVEDESIYKVWSEVRTKNKKNYDYQWESGYSFDQALNISISKCEERRKTNLNKYKNSEICVVLYISGLTETSNDQKIKYAEKFYGKKITNESFALNSHIFTNLKTAKKDIELLCGGVNYNFIIDGFEKGEEYRDKIGQCLLESEPEVSIKFLEDYIFNRVSEFFKNPELVKTLNYLGEPK